MGKPKTKKPLSRQEQRIRQIASQHYAGGRGPKKIKYYALVDAVTIVDTEGNTKTSTYVVSSGDSVAETREMAEEFISTNVELGKFKKATVSAVYPLSN